MRTKSWFALMCVFVVAIEAMVASAALAARYSPETNSQTNQEFFVTADQVLQVMSKILDLPVKSSLKKSIRTKAEIRQYLTEQQKKDESPQKRYADQRTLEAFGLIPKGFPLDSFLLDVLTDQVAGLYDPEKKEFFIADWIDPVEQKPVMAHELTHALDDQYFHLEKWQKAVRENDDSSLARDAVVEGSAVAAMMDYSLDGMHTSVRDVPDIAPFIESGVASEMDKDPNLAKAPQFIRDELLFPYLEGAEFTQQVLKATSGWPDFKKVFENPPVSTQQILHPTLYLQDVKPITIALPDLKSAIPHGWNKLDENVVGEFALGEVLKQFIDASRAEHFARMWHGDRYALFENKGTQQTILVVLLALDNEKDAESFFGAYSEAFEQKYAVKQPVTEGLEFASFGSAYLRCVHEECLSVEGADRSVFDRIDAQLGWPAEPSGTLADSRGAGPLHTPGSGLEIKPERHP
ncbi:MAG: hypothetical protein WBD73_06760 [Candidatus Acidiferrales bacterium]